MQQPLQEGKVRLVDERGAWKLYQKVVPDAPVENSVPEP